MNHTEALRSRIPDLVVEVVLYTVADGGRNITAYPGWGCPLMASKAEPLLGYHAWALLGDAPLLPNSLRTLGFVFMNKEGIQKMRSAGKFFLWEGRFIGEAVVID